MRRFFCSRSFREALPGDPVRDKIAEVNKIISKLDDQRHVFYMDIGAKFLDESGILPSRCVSSPIICIPRPKATTFGARP